MNNNRTTTEQQQNNNRTTTEQQHTLSISCLFFYSKKDKEIIYIKDLQIKMQARKNKPVFFCCI